MMLAIYTHMAAALVAGAAAFGGAWQIQAWRYDAQIAESDRQRAVETARAADKALTTTIGWQKEKDDALKRAQAKAKANADLLAAATAERDGLRNDNAELPERIARATRAALDKYATTATAVLEECTGKYLEMARAATGHAADSSTLNESWPK